MMLMFICGVVIIIYATVFVINEHLNERGIYDNELKDLTFILLLLSLVAATLVFLSARGVL